MEKLYITSLQNPLVKAWRALKDAKARAEQGLFLAEGDQQIKAFLARHSDAVLLPSAGHLWPGQATNAGKADSVSDNLRGEHDGFFYALLHKSAT